MTMEDFWGLPVNYAYVDSDITSNLDIGSIRITNNYYDFKSNTDAGFVPVASAYSPDIIQSLKIVIQGLTFVYTGTPFLIIQRIKWHPAERWEGPIFSRHRYHHRL